MLKVLSPQLRFGVVEGDPTHFDWHWGIGYKDKTISRPLREMLGSAIEPSALSETIDVRHQLLDEIDRLAEAYTDKVFRDHTENAAQLKRVGAKDAFLEVRFGNGNLKKYPNGYVVRRSKVLAALPVPDDVKARFAKYCGREIGEWLELITATEELIGYL